MSMIRKTPGVRPSVVKDHRDDTIAALNAENERLRKALVTIAISCASDEPSIYQFARAALERK
jgi:hypothetical protein